MKNKTLLYIAGAIAVYYLLKSNSAVSGMQRGYLISPSTVPPNSCHKNEINRVIKRIV